MNIESANLSTLVSNSTTVDSMAQPLAENSANPGGFSGTLVAQLELLSTMKPVILQSIQTGTPVTLPQISDLTGVTSVSVTNNQQNIAALTGNDLPSTAGIADSTAGNEAVLSAVTDTLKYIAVGKTAGEQAAVAEKNMQDVMAMATSVKQNSGNVDILATQKPDTAGVAPATPNSNDVASMTILNGQNNNVTANTVSTDQTDLEVSAKAIIPTVQNQDKASTKVTPIEQKSVSPLTAISLKQRTDTPTIKSTTAGQNRESISPIIIPAEQNQKNVTATPVSIKPNAKEMGSTVVPVQPKLKELTAAPTKQHKAVLPSLIAQAKQNKKNTAATAAAAQQTLIEIKPVVIPAQMGSNRFNDKVQQKKSETGTQVEEVSKSAQETLPAINLSTAIPTEQTKSTNNLASANMAQESGQLSISKPSTGYKSDQTANNAKTETKFDRPVQAKQDSDIKLMDTAGQPEKAGSFDRQVLSVEGEKSLPRAGLDTSLSANRLADNKIEAPAITKPLSHPEWNKDLGDRIVWMTSRAIPAAEIRLNPQHLGPISVRVDVVDDQATVVFTAQHALTREALESSIPKLREMMNSQHLNLAEVNVSHGASSEQGRSQAQNFAQTAEGQRQNMADGGSVETIDDVEQEIESGRAVVSNGLLSIYA